MTLCDTQSHMAKLFSPYALDSPRPRNQRRLARRCGAERSAPLLQQEQFLNFNTSPTRSPIFRAALPLCRILLIPWSFFTFPCLPFYKKKSGEEPQTHCHPQKCRPQNPRSTRVAQLAAHALPTFGGGGPNARTTRPPPRRSPFLCIDLIPRCLCPETGVELLTAGSARSCDVSLPSAVQSSFHARSPSRHQHC